MTLYTVRTGFSVFKNGGRYSGGQFVDLTPAEFVRHKHKLENTQSTVTQGIYRHQSSYYVTITIDIPAQTWTDFGSVVDIKEYQVLGNDGSDLTDSFEYRQFQGKWQIFSLTAQNNLQIILEKS